MKAEGRSEGRKWKSMMTSNANHEAGVALIITLMALLLMSAFGAGLLLMTAAETRIAAGFRDAQAALYAADAEIGRASCRERV